MKKIITTCLVLGTLMSSYAQLAKSRADKYFNDFSYTKAIELYEFHLKKNEGDNEAILKLAESYVFLNQPEKAVEWYSKSDMTVVDSKHYLNYANMLSQMQHYDKSKVYYDKYQQAVGGDVRSSKHIEGINNLKGFFEDSLKYEIKPFGYNSAASDFAPSFYGDGILFVSGRPRVQNLTRRSHSWDMQSYLDLYSHNVGGAVVNYFDRDANSPYHEGRTYVTKDSSKMFLSRNNFLNGKKSFSKNGINKIKIYITEKNDKGEWDKFVEFPYNDDEYSVGDPFYLENENTLFFVSDMPGGFGDMDIYKSVYKNGNWSKPVNLGSEINSEGEERSPFMSGEGHLFFASDGRDGLGGLDIYHALYSYVSNQSSEVMNMGYPLNSSRDDFGLILKGKEGYFASNRLGGKGKDDIYQIKIKDKPKAKIELLVKLKREDQEDDESVVDSLAVIQVVDVETGEVVLETKGDETGKVSLYLAPNKQYTYKVTHDSLEVAGVLTTGTPKSITKEEVLLIRELPNPTKVLIADVLKDKDEHIGLEDGHLVVINDTKGYKTQAFTEELGKFELRLEPGTSYVIKMSKNGYLTDCITFTTGDPSRDLHEFDVPPSLEKIAVNKVFQIDNVYFDLAKWFIRPDAAKELDKVVTFLKENPTILVELGSHTDVRGSDAYNLKLSDKRAKSSRDYIVSQGIDADRITGKGYGETQLVNKCKNGVRCSEELHQQNRRTEIKITGVKIIDENNQKEDQIEGQLKNSSTSDCDKVKLVKKI